jgi:hypothetical protein
MVFLKRSVMDGIVQIWRGIERVLTLLIGGIVIIVLVVLALIADLFGA